MRRTSGPWSKAMARARAEGVWHVVFGDLFLEDIRAYREKQLAACGMTPVFPVWGIDTRQLAEEMLAGGLSARISLASTRGNWIGVSRGADLTRSCWRICRRASIRAGRMASSTRSRARVRCSAKRFRCAWERLSSGMGLCSRICCRRSKLQARCCSLEGRFLKNKSRSLDCANATRRVAKTAPLGMTRRVGGQDEERSFAPRYSAQDSGPSSGHRRRSG